MSVTIVKFGAGNLGSVVNMFRRLGAATTLADTAEGVSAAEKLLLPGVGAFDAAVAGLRQQGLVDALDEAVLERRVPVLGICLGMQLLADASDEGSLPGLGWIPGKVTRLDEDGTGTGAPPRVPHMGWNTVRSAKPSPILSGLDEEARFYFAHSYRFVCEDEADVTGSTVYGCEFTSVVERGHVFGAQFHPEKSHRHGMALLSNFVAL